MKFYKKNRKKTKRKQPKKERTRTEKRKYFKLWRKVFGSAVKFNNEMQSKPLAGDVGQYTALDLSDLEE